MQAEYDSKTNLELIPHTLLRKYIAYARDNIHPKLEISDDRMANLYANLRKESEETGSVAITIRNVESMVIPYKIFSSISQPYIKINEHF